MTGYQEVLTDPSYRGQIVTMTYPLVGNYGTNLEDVESDRVQVAGFVVREYQDYPSNYRSRASLPSYLKARQILGVDSLDTRALTRHLRNIGVMRAVISTQDLSAASLRAKVLKTPSMKGQNLASVVSTPHPYLWRDGLPRALADPERPLDLSTWP